MLGYHPVKTRTLVEQWRLDLVGLERKLQRNSMRDRKFLPRMVAANGPGE
jgi:hypothetical protein